MKTVRATITQLFFLLFLLLLFPNFVQAETTECTAITSLPYTISTQGIYCLKGNLATSMTSGAAITISTNNVVIDLNGYKIGGLGAGPGTDAYGIYAQQQQNITIRNGTVRGFMRGIYLRDFSPYATSRAHLIEDIRADLNQYEGIVVEGQGNIIRNNQVVSTGGSTLSNDAYGIVVGGPGARVLRNEVIETKEHATGSAYGVYLDSGLGSVFENNRIGNATPGTGTSYGIRIASSSDVLVSNNHVTAMNNGIYYDGSSTGLYMNNLASGCPSPFFGGTAAGSTNYSSP